MKRISLTVALGAALLLAGCNSTSGTPTANKSASPSASSAVSAPASNASSSAAVSGPQSSAPNSSGSAAVSAPASSGGAAASVQASTSSVKSNTTTVGDSKTSLDAASAQWFSTFCGGFAPVVALAQTAGASIGAQATDPAKAQTSIVNLYQTFGQAFTETASKLQVLAPPTFDGGPAFATKVVAALQTAGPTFTANATKLKAIDVTKDPGGFSSALSGLGATMMTAMAPLQDLGALKLTPQTQAAFEALPACAKLKTVAGG